MTTRLWICGTLAVLAAIALIAVTVRSAEVKPAEVIASLATGAIGTIVTVGFVDLLLERDRRQEKAKTLAWRAINALDHAVWVWQGGSRRFDAGELLGLLELIRPDDPLAESTETLLLRLGELSQNTLQMNDTAVTGNKPLVRGLEALQRLGYIRDTNPPMSINEIRQHMSTAAAHLLESVAIPVMPVTPVSLRLHESERAPSEAWQRYRLNGERIAVTGGDGAPAANLTPPRSTLSAPA